MDAITLKCSTLFSGCGDDEHEPVSAVFLLPGAYCGCFGFHNALLSVTQIHQTEIQSGLVRRTGPHSSLFLPTSQFYNHRPYKTSVTVKSNYSYHQNEHGMLIMLKIQSVESHHFTLYRVYSVY